MNAKALNADRVFLAGYEFNTKIAVVLSVFVILIAGIVFFVLSSTNTTDRQGLVEHPSTVQATVVNSEGLSVFDQISCGTLLSTMTVNISNAPVSMYLAGYNIDGSSGDSVKWNATSQPSVNFSLSGLPNIFYVSSVNEFEGCGTNREITDKDKINSIEPSLKFSNCSGKQASFNQRTLELYSIFDMYAINSENSLQYVTMIMSKNYSMEDNILQSIGCSA
ncbi:MAG: hypothetical protein V1836_04490 [Candidatus Aenigmatarchaeota archaeon]